MAERLTAHEVARRVEERELRELAKVPAFRKYLWRVWRDAGIGDDIACGDPLLTASMEGSRALGLNQFRAVERAAPGTTAAILAEYGVPGISKHKPPEEPDERTSDPESDD